MHKNQCLKRSPKAEKLFRYDKLFKLMKVNYYQGHGGPHTWAKSNGFWYSCKRWLDFRKFFTLAQISKKSAKSLAWALSTLRPRCWGKWSGTFFGRFEPNWKLSEIKPPLFSSSVVLAKIRRFMSLVAHVYFLLRN